VNDLQKPLTAVFFGPSGAGKGTQASLLADFLERNSDLGVLRFETGERLRGFGAGSGEAGRRVSKMINEGRLAPEFLPSHLITTFLLQEFTGTEHLIIDGMRRINQVMVLDEALAFYERTDYVAIVLDLPAEEAVGRLHIRGRSDDMSDEKIRRRLAWYTEETLPAIEAMRERGRRIIHVDGRQSIEAIHQEILRDLGLA
jgi:adenylate kinase